MKNWPIERNLVRSSSRENSRTLTRTREFKVELAKCSLGVLGVLGVQGETARINAPIGQFPEPLAATYKAAIEQSGSPGDRLHAPGSSP
jgi:hypothetical protein